MPQTLKINSPLKGVSRAFGREAQPPNTCFDSLNVFPTDRYGRMRIAQRTGIGQLDATGVSPVRLLHVASSARTFAAGSTTLLNEPFTYANGNLITVSSTAWKSYKADDGGELGIVNMVDWTQTADAMVVASNKVQSGTTYLQASAVSQAALVLTSDYDITLDIVYGATEPNISASVISQLDVATHDGANAAYATVSGFLGFGDTILQIVTPDNSDTVFLGSVPTLNATHTLGLRRRGTSFSVVWDGVVKSTVTNATGTSNMGVGFFIDGTSGPEDLTTVDNFVVTTPGAATTNIDRTILTLVATSGADTYVGDPTNMALATASATFPISSSSLFVSAATLFGYTYIVDGVGKPKRLRLSDNTMIAYTESAGTAPTSTAIACNWRGRLVLSGSTTDPQNFFMSKAGDPLNFNYGDGTPISAFAGNDSKAGLIGQPIHALIPVSDDILVIGCEQSMWAVRGDPADGGSITQITDFAGISQANSWTKAADGSIYFVGPRGFFKMNAAATEVAEVSQFTYPQFFQNLNRATNFINCIYDADRYGVWVFVCPLTQGAAATSMFYDIRAEGFWPQNFANQLNAGPTAAVYWDGYDTDTRYPVLGGFDGFLYAFNATNRTDNGGTIEAYLLLGPIHPTDVEATLIGTTVAQGELSAADLSTPSRWNLNFTLYTGSSAYSVTEGRDTASNAHGVITWPSQGSTKTMRQRLRGEWFSVLLSNSAVSNYFSFESVNLEFNTAGRNRRQGL